MKKTFAIIYVSIIFYLPTFGQNVLWIDEIRNKCKTLNQMNFQSHREIDSSLNQVDSLTFRRVFGESKLLGQWDKDCCFYYGTIQTSNKNINLIIIERAGHYRPYLVLAVVDKDQLLVDELMLAKHFVDSGEAIEISSTMNGDKIEQITLDYNIGYEPFFKEIKSDFLISDNGNVELTERKEEMKRIK